MSRRKSRSAVSASRRSFLKVAGTAAAAAVGPTLLGPTLLGPTLLGAARKSGQQLPIVGKGAYTYEAHHGWGEIPSHVVWGETHGVCVDREGLVYVKHRSRAPVPIDSIVVFDAAGRFVRSFGREYHQGGHGIEIRVEDGEEFLYLCDVHNRQVIKATLKGEEVWKRSFPVEPGVYQNLEQFRPTNVAFAPDGGFYVADGYGSHFIHQYDREAKWVRTWGGEGDAPGKMRTPHGIWLDNRPGREPSLVVADRANARLQYFSLTGEHLSFVSDVSFPAHFDIRGEVLLVPDLHARVTLLDGQNGVLAHLGYDPAWTTEVLADNFAMRSAPARWQAGRFVHPHDACFDHAGNIFVAEWVPTGRVTWLRHVDA